MKPYSILLADDDDDDRALFLEALFLLDPSVRVETVENGERLLSHLNASSVFPDCIFLDLNMPKKNGKECLHEIRRNARTRQIPVVIYSTSVHSKDVEDTFRSGASCFIRKPNSFKELMVVLDKILSSSPPQPDPHNNLRSTFVLNTT